jgi:hypothetical protein
MRCDNHAHTKGCDELVALERSMPTPPKPSIREVLIAEIKAQEPKSSMDASLQQSSILSAAARKLHGYDEQAILTQWGELFRTGLVAWGLNLSNPDPPFFHLTERGRQALANSTRDPSNPAGYLRHLASIGSLDPVAMSYLSEGLDCHAAGFFKAAAVMVGAAAESVILKLRDTTEQKLTSLRRPIPKAFKSWQIRTVSDGLRAFFETQKAQFRQDLREPFEAYWSAFAQQIRAARNDAGHPTNVDPVTPDTVHASLLIFPELVRLANALSVWVKKDLK